MIESAPATTAAARPVRIITYAWGESYVDELLAFAVPALLAPGNLPHIASQVECDLTLVTEERFFAKIAAHPAIVKAKTYCPIRLVNLDDLVTRSDKYGMALTYALHRGFADLGPAMTDYWLIFFNADFILADGSLKNLLDQFMSGERLIASPSYCTNKEESIPELERWRTPDGTILTIPPREMAQIILRHRHATIRGKTINDPTFHMYYTDQFYWMADDNTLLGHQMPIAIVGMRPERYLEEPNSFWDHGLIDEFCPTAKPKVFGDSDQFLMLELRSAGIAQDQIVHGPRDARELGERMISWVTPYQASFAHLPLTLHSSDLPASVDDQRRQLDEFVDEVMSFAPAFPSHLDHPQWNYHWPDFMKSRHELLAGKYGSMTADLPQPQWLYPIDRLWWRLNELETSHARTMRLITDAIKEIDRELDDAYPAVLMDGLSTMKSASSQALVSENASLTLPQDSGADTCAGSRRPAIEISSVVQAVEDAFARKRREAAEKKAMLHGAMAAARQLFDEKGTEFNNLKREYDKLLRTRVKTAAIPIVQRRVASDVPAVRVGGKLRRFVQSVHDAVFGRWPRMTMLSPYRVALQPLVRAIDRAKVDGARRVLLVGDNPRMHEAVMHFAETYALVSLAGVLTGLFHRSMPKEQTFDLCILDLSGLDASQFYGVINDAKHFATPGSFMIAFQMSGGSTLGDIPPPVNGKLEFSGSALALAAAAIYSSHLSYTGRSKFLRRARRLAALALSTPVAFVANCVEAIAPRRGPVPARLRTSLTAVSITKLFEEDDNSIDYAIRAGTYASGIEAPTVPDNRVNAEIANPQGTAVILTFGQSNAANEGAVHYVPRHAVHVFNIFDMNYYKAIDPLPGATHDGGSVWGRLGDKLIEAGRFNSVLFVPIAFSGSFMKDWTPFEGNRYQRLQFALVRLKRAGIRIDLLCWHQGEADANHTTMAADEYARRFRLLVRHIRNAGVDAPIYIAKASICENNPHPYYNHEQIRRAQQQLVSLSEGLLPGPDTDKFDGDFRSDGCHLSEKGLDAVAQAWLDSIMNHSPSVRRTRDVRLS